MKNSSTVWQVYCGIEVCCIPHERWHETGPTMCPECNRLMRSVDVAKALGHQVKETRMSSRCLDMVMEEAGCDSFSGGLAEV